MYKAIYLQEASNVEQYKIVPKNMKKINGFTIFQFDEITIKTAVLNRFYESLDT